MPTFYDPPSRKKKQEPADASRVAIKHDSTSVEYANSAEGHWNKLKELPMYPDAKFGDLRAHVQAYEMDKQSKKAMDAQKQERATTERTLRKIRGE